MRRFLPLGLLAFMLGAPAASAQVDLPGREVPVQLDGQQQAVAKIVVLHGTNDGKGIDPAIGDLPQLKQPPFSAYDSYKLLDRGSVKLDPSGKMSLPDGGSLGLEVQAADGDRYTVVASITKKGGKKFLPGATVSAKRGEYFFLAGQKYKNGILVLGIRLVDK